MSSRQRPSLPAKAAFAGFRFPPEVIVVAIRWYLRCNLSYRDVEELPVERGVEVDHVTGYRWVQRFTPLLADAARFARAVDQHGQVIDVLVSIRRDAAAPRRFFRRAIAVLKVKPTEVITDAADAATTRSATTHRLSPRSPRRSPNSLKQSDRTSTDRLTASVTPTTQRRLPIR